MLSARARFYLFARQPALRPDKSADAVRSRALILDSTQSLPDTVVPLHLPRDHTGTDVAFDGLAELNSCADVGHTAST